MPRTAPSHHRTVGIDFQTLPPRITLWSQVFRLKSHWMSGNSQWLNKIETLPVCSHSFLHNPLDAGMLTDVKWISISSMVFPRCFLFIVMIHRKPTLPCNSKSKYQYTNKKSRRRMHDVKFTCFSGISCVAKKEICNCGCHHAATIRPYGAEKRMNKWNNLIYDRF